MKGRHMTARWKMQKQKPEKHVIVIGAGPAGLTAAYQLLKRGGCSVTVVEATDKIGGISRTDSFNGNRMDLGGHRFFSKSEEVTKFWEELMPLQGSPSYDDMLTGREVQLSPDGPDPEKTDRVMLRRRRVSRIYFMHRFFDYPVTLSASTLRSMGFCNTLKVGFGYLAACIHKREENSLEDFYINRFGKPLYSMFFEGYTEKLWGVHPSKIAKDWGAQRVKGLSLRKALADMLAKAFGRRSKVNETSLIEEFFYPKFGPGQLWETLAGEIVSLGGKIMTSTECVRFSTENDRITGATLRQGGCVFNISADAVFSSMPVKDLVKALPDVPDSVRAVASELPYRDFITVGLLCKKLKLENKTSLKTLGNIIPDCWIYVQDRNVRLGRVQVFNNWSPYMVTSPDSTVWIGLEYFCKEGDEMWEMSDADFISMAVSEVESIGLALSEDVIDSTRIRVKKAYPAYFGSYARFGEVREHLDTIENLYCIGRNGQHRYNNMDHSMLTAFTAVRAFHGECDKVELWNVNAEEEYHEEKTS